MDDGQRRQYEQPYEQQREREACLLWEEEDRQRQETRRREEAQRYRIEADADRRHWENEEGLRQREQAWRGLKSLWKRLGLDPKTGLPREPQC